ncbi:MAG: DUF3486 family protein [Candidatus Binataceae bacterium]|nr:DUF3486 family protein [Candidatus Binataceae bacterium]
MKLLTLDPKLRAELDRRLVEGHFSDYSGLAKWLGEKGFKIAAKTVHRYGSLMERRLEQVRTATAQARAVVDEAGGDDDRITAATLKLVQQRLFAVLVELDDADLKPSNLAAIANSVAQMTRAAVMQERWTEESRARLSERVGKAERKVIAQVRTAVEAAGGKGLSDDAQKQIRAALLEITR